MSDYTEFIPIGNKNRGNFESFIPENEAIRTNPNEFVFGVNIDSLPSGAVFCSKDGKELTIGNISMDYTSSNAEETARSILSGVLSNSGAWGFDRVLLKYTDDQPIIGKKLLKEAGFVEFRKEAEVYRVDAFNLGTLLRDGPDSYYMRKEAVRLLDEGRARVFFLSPDRARGLFADLYPKEKFSFMTVTEDDLPDTAVCVSQFTDGSLYLSGIDILDENQDDLWGLLYLSLSSVFMEIEPEGEFYLPVVNSDLEILTKRLISPLKKGAEKQKVFCAYGGTAPSDDEPE